MKTKQIFDPICFKLYSIAIQHLQDPDKSGLDIYYYLKDGLKGRHGDKKMFSNPVKKGALYCIGKYSYNKYILCNHSEENKTDQEIIQDNQHLLWYSEEFIEFLKFHNIDHEEIANLEKIINYSNRLYNSGKEDYELLYEDYLSFKSRIIRKKLDVLKDELYDSLISLEEYYSVSVGERIFHDRKLCKWISDLIVFIGLPGEDINGKLSQWVPRKTWPKWVKETLIIREGGRCPDCNRNLYSKKIKLNVDHIVPISKGGSNDIVNLQLLCEKCNKSKKAKPLAVTNSIPKYFSK
ncbi:HNH endonuclease [Leptospira vanthielii]|uniref:HNH endonuclease domain protein n=1 Tax=Leptospira vanthielii serovar Holland str. Waz Holland = ATCC 700522 TaxID=1218591 RepID=N1W2S2_9LEPT|nr:HNH endonuclease [Leptospira vanthielii]EMY67780.1 HNH endonuclease domain protein [Leptospira vanthielii serovar Holland str. Waz Holland = ATCC 700522]